MRNIADHIHPGVSGNQNFMTSAAAASSAATVIAQLNQKFHPAAKPKLGLMKRVPYSPNEPATGRYVDISPRDCMRRNTMRPMSP